jgi:hypothetical protein
MRRPGDAAHLARRLRWSLRPPAVSGDDLAWVAAQLREAEFALWTRQSSADQAHSLGVARRCAGGDPWLVQAALLHDVGKAEASLGVAGRVLATALALVRVRRFPGRLGAYLRYPDLGADRLAAAGADPRVVAWAREHHWRPADWTGTVPPADAARLAAADH